MKTFILSLVFLSPLMAYAISLLRKEFTDPLGLHHESFRKKSSAAVLKTGPAMTLDSFLNSSVNRIAIISLIGILLIFENAAAISIFGILIVIVLGFRWLDLKIKRAETKAKAAVELEFPSFVELFSILVVAGESPSAALIRISKVTTGFLAKDLSESIARLRDGKSLTEVLELLANRTGIPAIRRFSDSLIIALERGSPLAEVLHRQVNDVRKSHQAALIKQAGKAELALMIPVVFLILPISVLFALWPSYVALGRNLY
jgi:tight adherence protein C